MASFFLTVSVYPQWHVLSIGPVDPIVYSYSKEYGKICAIILREEWRFESIHMLRKMQHLSEGQKLA